MSFQIDDIIIGKVTKVRPYALFLSFGSANGLLHISEISDHYVRDIEKIATIGDEIKVKVLDVDEENGFLRVSYKKVPDDQKYCSHDNSSKKIPNFNDKDFEELENSLPAWIDNTLRKAGIKK